MEFIHNIFSYNSAEPLIFTKFFFWGFFAFVLFGYSFIANKINIRSIYLLIVSIFFYYKSSGFFFLLLIFTTIVSYIAGNLMYKSESNSKRKIFLALSVFVNLFILAYFKYTYFFVDLINQMFHTDYIARNYLAETFNLFAGTSFDTSKIFLPVGISFFTFQAMSYTVDIYYRKLEPAKNVIDFGFYISFFPQLVAGPIVRASEFIPQIYKKFKLSKYEFGIAIFMILKGLVKKIVIGDYIAVNFIDRIFANPEMYSGFENLSAVIAYALQIYADFSGYTDIAIGLALMMGFRLSPNFNSPYKSKSPDEFWSRWHISLSSWLKDYLYIPLGGNRKITKGSIINTLIILFIIILLAANKYVTLIILSLFIILSLIYKFSKKARKFITTNINIMITMTLGGLWHGANWNFLIWGIINGLGIIISKAIKKLNIFKVKKNLILDILKILLTFAFICFTWVFFRAKDYNTAITVLNQIWNHFSANILLDVVMAYYKVFIIISIGYIGHWLSYNFKDKCKDIFANMAYWKQILICVFIVFIIYQSICSDMQSFIYFQF